MTGYSVVIPTVGRPSLQVLLDVLATGHDIVVVDDRAAAAAPLAVGPSVRVLRSERRPGRRSERGLACGGHRVGRLPR